MKTLFAGANARAEEQLCDTYAIELIDQKTREAQAVADMENERSMREERAVRSGRPFGVQPA